MSFEIALIVGARVPTQTLGYEAFQSRGWLSPHPSRFATNVALAGVFLAAYVALAWISYIHEYKGIPVTPWNPALGVVFALMISAGAWGGLVLFGGVVTAELVVLQSKLAWEI